MNIEEIKYLMILEDFVLFYEAQEREDLIDGAYDPYSSYAVAKILLDNRKPNWRKQEPAMEV